MHGIQPIRTRPRAGGRSQPEEDLDGVNWASSRTGEKINKSWFRRQYSKQMDGNNNASGGEDEAAIAIAIAAAAYAVDSLDELDHSRMITRGGSSLWRARSKRETITQPEPSNSSKPFPGHNVGDGPVKTVQKRPTFSEKLLLDRTDSGKAKQQPQEGEDEEDLPVPLQKPKKRTASSEINPVALPPPLPPLPPKFPATKPGNPPLFEIQSQATAEPTSARIPTSQLENPQSMRKIGAGNMGGVSEADAWEIDEMNKIRVKYEKLSQTISTWEDDKKKATRRKLDENERAIEMRRAKAQKEFRTETERIEQIAGGARAQAEERRRNEEFKTREKADRIRRTGKAGSNSCSCF